MQSSCEVIRHCLLLGPEAVCRTNHGRITATDEEQEVDIDSVIQALIASRDRVFQKAESCITSAQKRQKETYDRKRQPGEIAVGTQVLLENTAQKQRKGGKLEPAWLGPYNINRCVGKGVYELSKDVEDCQEKS